MLHEKFPMLFLALLCYISKWWKDKDKDRADCRYNDPSQNEVYVKLQHEVFAFLMVIRRKQQNRCLLHENSYVFYNLVC